MVSWVGGTVVKYDLFIWRREFAVVLCTELVSISYLSGELFQIIIFNLAQLFSIPKQASLADRWTRTLGMRGLVITLGRALS